MLKSSLSNAYILVSGTMAVPNTEGAANPNNKKNVIIQNCPSFTDCASEINNTQIDNAKDIDKVMPMYNLIEYSYNYSEIYRTLWLYYRDEPFLDNNGAIVDFPEDNNNSASMKVKIKIADRTGNDGTKNVKVRVPLKYLSNFWRTLEMLLINCEISLILNWSERCFTIDNLNVGQESTFTITDTKLYVHLQLYQLRVMQNYCNNWNQQLAGINIIQKEQYMKKTDI